MIRSITFSDSNADGLDGQWAEILRAGTYDGENYTPGDLDSMVSEYQKRQDGDKAPVALGLPPSGSNPGMDQPIGRIDALRKVGNSVQAKFANIDPRAEQLHARGVFPKKSVQLKRSSDGVSLQRVGLIHPVFRDYWHNDETPSLDRLEKETMGNKDHIFAEGKGVAEYVQDVVNRVMSRSNGHSQSDDKQGPSASAAIAALKDNGYWTSRFDKYRFPAVFSELDRTPLLGQIVGFLRSVMDKGDPTSTLLTERARYFAAFHGLTFGEALSQLAAGVTGTAHSLDEVTRLVQGGTWGNPVSAQQRQMEKDTSDKAVAANALDPQLAALAWNRARSTGAPFKQALAEVAAEHPDLALKHLAAWDVA